MIFQAELKDIYWGACGALQLFEQARHKLSQAAERGGERLTLITSPNSALPEHITALTPTSNDYVQSEMVPSVDDILTFDFAFTGPQNLAVNGMDYP